MKRGYAAVRGLVTIGLLFLPFTTLRFGPIGLGEISIFIAFMVLLTTNDFRLESLPQIKPVLAFWLFYPAWLIVGFSYNVIILNHVSGYFDLAMFDWAAYISVLILVIVLGNKNTYNGITAGLFFEKVFLYLSILFSILYIISLFTPFIFGQPLRYYYFFSPLVENVHQAAMITCAMPFIMAFLAFRSENFFRKIVYFCFAALFVEMAIESGTTKASLAMTVGFAVGVLSFTTNLAKGRGRIFLYFVAAVTLFIVMSIYWDETVLLSVNFFRDEDGSAARESLYYYGFVHALDSPIVGYGPGSQVRYDGGFSDAHNTMLTILLQGGIIGVVAFIVTFFRIIVRASISPALIGAIAAIGIYAAGGDILRRLPIWVLILGVLILGDRLVAMRGDLRGSVARYPV